MIKPYRPFLRLRKAIALYGWRNDATTRGEWSPIIPTSLTSRDAVGAITARWGLRNPFWRNPFFAEPAEFFTGGAAAISFLAKQIGVFGVARESTNSPSFHFTEWPSLSSLAFQ